MFHVSGVLFVILLIGCWILFWLSASAVKKMPWVWYAACLAADALLLAGVSGVLGHGVWMVVSPLMKKGLLALAVFFVVMLMGCFPTGGKVGKRLRPIRAELSIMACILVAGHMGVYVMRYLALVLQGVAPKANVMVALVLAIALLALLVPLFVTSFHRVRRAMDSASWKRLQRWAYVFFGLTYVHILVMLAPGILAGTRPALASAACYTLAFAAYALLRVRYALHPSRSF